MDTLIPVVIILAIVCFVGYKHRDKISALYDKVQNDGLDDEPEVVTSEPVSGFKVVSAPYKVEAYNGVGDPPSQEAWTEWRNRQPASTRFAIPEVWKPAPVDNPDFGPKDPGKAEQPEVKGGKFGNSGFLKVGKFPVKWPATQTRYLCNFVAGKEYPVSFTRPGPTGVTFTPSANSQTSGAKFTFKLSGAVADMTSKSRSAMANFPVDRLGAGEYTLTVVADKDTQSIVTFK